MKKQLYETFPKTPRGMMEIGIPVINALGKGDWKRCWDKKSMLA